MSTDVPDPLFSAKALDHAALRVRDLDRSRDFYVRYLGASVLRQTETACFLGIGDTDFLALFVGNEPMIEHFCFALDDYSAGEAAMRLEQAGLAVHRTDDRVFFKDPDGLLVQISGPGGELT